MANKMYKVAIIPLLMIVFINTNNNLTIYAEEFERPPIDDEFYYDDGYQETTEYEEIPIIPGQSKEICTNEMYSFKLNNVEELYYEFYILDNYNYMIDSIIINSESLIYSFTTEGTYKIRYSSLDEYYHPKLETESEFTLNVSDCTDSDSEIVDTPTEEIVQLQGNLEIDESGNISYLLEESDIKDYMLAYSIPNLDVEDVYAFNDKEFEANISEVEIIQLYETYEKEDGTEVENSYELSYNSITGNYMIRNVANFEVDLINKISTVEIGKLILLIIEIILIIFTTAKINNIRKKNKRRKKMRKMRSQNSTKKRSSTTSKKSKQQKKKGHNENK